MYFPQISLPWGGDLKASDGGLGLLRRHVVVSSLGLFLFFIFFCSSDEVIFFSACGRW
jgi:hypothetical protein